MSNAEQLTPELYRELAEKLRELARQSHLADIRRDLWGLAERFERVAACQEAQRRQRPARDSTKE